jgi:hypothetical protein
VKLKAKLEPDFDMANSFYTYFKAKKAPPQHEMIALNIY